MAEGEDQEVRQTLKVFGRVQGVGFRWWTRQQARRLGLRGYVRNCPDGTVEVALAGPAEAVTRMRRLLQDGPPSARVERVAELAAPDEVPEGFEIGRYFR